MKPAPLPHELAMIANNDVPWVGEHRIPTGITLGTGRLSGRAHTIDAIDVRDGTCHRAKTAHVTRPRNDTAWTGPKAPVIVRPRTSWKDL